MMARIAVTLVLSLTFAVLLSGCVRTAPIQLRMAEPNVGPDENGTMNPPVATFQRYAAKVKHRSPDKKVAVGRTVVNPSRPKGPAQTAAFVWENPHEPFRTRVDVRANSVYGLSIALPENYEVRRIEVLTAKSETLYNAIQAAEDRLQANLTEELQLLDDQTRQHLIDRNHELLSEIASLRKKLVDEGKLDEAVATAVRTSAPIAELQANEAALARDDKARDKAMTPSMVESLVDQIEQWRAELNDIKARIVALTLMVENPNKPYPRVIRGWLQTFGQTSYTAAGAIPFVVEDEYLDWLRDDKVVTIVSYDPNVRPTQSGDGGVADLPVYWPESNLTIIESLSNTATVPREAHGGTRASTGVNRKHYFNVTARTIEGTNGVERTYLESEDGQRMWVFGPDVESPANVEVWMQDESGQPSQKLYPGAPRPEPGKAYVRHIAGYEGGAFDPITEAEKRGRIIAITRLGNKLGAADEVMVHGRYATELERARARAEVAQTQ